LCFSDGDKIFFFNFAPLICKDIFFERKMKDVSIITINRNNLDGLKATYNSIISQSHNDWEWIVIDGASTKGDKSFLEQHQDDISYWCSEPDSGVYNAMNKGIAKASGNYLIFMNSGDTFHDAAVLDNVFKNHHEADVLYGDWTRIYEDGHHLEIKSPDTFSLHFISRDNVCHQAMFIKGSVLKKFPYDESYRLYADWAKWIELTLRKCTFEHLPIQICYFMMGGMSCTANTEEEFKMMQQRELSPAIQETLKLIDHYQEPHPLAQEADRLIKKKKIYKKLIHCAIRLSHLLEKL